MSEADYLAYENHPQDGRVKPTGGTAMVDRPSAVGTSQPIRRYYCLTPEIFTGDCDRVAAATVVAMISRLVNNRNPLIIEVQDGD